MERLYTGNGDVEGPNQARIEAISTVTHPLLLLTAISISIKRNDFHLPTGQTTPHMPYPQVLGVVMAWYNNPT